MRIIDVQGFGQFILRNPSETDDGVVKMKSCKGYSLEYEFSNKTLTLEESTYNFWNPLSPDSTIVGIIMSEMPSWSIGTISTDLIGKYRTFSVDNQNIYDFIKSTLQETYECVFEFDTYNRKVNIRSMSSAVSKKPVYISTSNLAKEIEIEENLDDLVTVLDVSGADGVDIRSVNPMGTNKIYNLDSFMNTNYFSSSMIAKWKNWKAAYDSYQTTYYNLVVAQNMLISQYTTEYAALGDLQGELSTLEAKKATLIQAVAIDSSQQSNLNTTNSEITAKNKEITAQNNKLTQINSQLSNYTAQLKKINEATAFSAFGFSESELKLLDRYFICGSLTDSTFVANSVNSYSTDSDVVRDFSAIFNLTNLTTLEKANYTSDITFYTVRGGSIAENSTALQLNAEIVNGTLQVNSDNTFVMSLYLNTGSINGDSFPSGTLSLTGTLRSNVVTTSNTLQFATSTTTAYMTYEVSEYQRMAVAWDLYNYGKETLEQLSSPTYSFDIESINFFALDDFVEFAKNFVLGEKIYLETSMGVLTPIAVGVSIDFDDLSKLELEFGSTFTSSDADFTLKDLLQDSVSLGKSLDFNQYNYSSFVSSGAQTQVKDFMESAINTMKNMILSGKNNEVTIDEAGLRCRKYDESTGTYSPKQIWIANNAIMFTDDNWDNATIGIGEFVDKNLGSLYGIVTPALVGTILAGSNLIIESEKQDGGVAVFKMDGEGASLHNASFNLYGTTGGRIDLGSTFGIVAGTDKDNLFSYSKGVATGVKTAKGKTVTCVDDLDSGDTPNANFWVDMDGDLYLKGIIDATGGTFRGSLEVGGSTAFRVDSQGNLKIGGTASSPAFQVTAAGNLTANSGTFKGTVKGATFQKSDGTSMMNSSYQFTSGYLDLTGLNVGSGNFVVDSNGNVTVNGKITMKSGSSINWSNVTETNASSSSAYKQADSAYSLAEVAQKRANSAYDYADDAYWLAQDAIDAADSMSVTDKQIFDILTSGGTKFGIFSDSTTNRLYVNANYIKTGTIDADVVTLGSGWGGFCCGMGHDGTRYTYGAKMYGSDDDFYFIATNKGVRMQGDSNSFTVTNTGMYATDEISQTSDRRVKNTISYDMDKYSKFFMNLKPSYFKYNAGTSGRFHIGFIAQEVKDAIIDSGLSTNDFAGLTQCAGDGDVHDAYKDQYYLRYNNFIALNTYMIQQLYHKIEILEQEISKLKGD
jgi:hypothetical protein